jgi:DNA-binding Lrp family transcriptional regulator
MGFVLVEHTVKRLRCYAFYTDMGITPNELRDAADRSNLDEVDLLLVRALQENARRSNKELAALAGIAQSTCSERIRSLVSRGVLTGFHAAVDHRLLGRGMEAIIAVRLRPQSREVVDSFRSFVLSLPETLTLYEVTGPNDCLLHVAVGDMHELRGFILDRLTHRPEVAQVQTSTIYERTNNYVPEGRWSPPSVRRSSRQHEGRSTLG